MEQREATARMLPHSLEAEKSVLGGMLISREAAELVCEALKPEDFYLPAHQDIYTAMLQLYNRGNAVDSVTLIDALEREGKLNAVGSVSYITELSLFVPSAANVSHYIRIVEDRSVMRQLIRAGTDIVQDAQTGERPVGDMLDDAERRIFNISMKKSEDTLVHIEKTAMDTYFHIGELMALKGKLSGITTGFTDLDKLTSGLQRSDLIIVAGRPSMGKTAFALNVAQNAALKGATICIFSLEMSREQLVRRMLCANAGVDMQRVNTGNTTDADLIELSTALADLSATNIYIDDTAGVSVAEIRSRCRKQKSRGGLDLIVIDYLQLMKTAGNSDNRATEISDVTRSLKILARELNVPIILLSQLSRAPELRQDKRPMLSDLRESGSIEQDADIVIFLYRDDYYNENTEKPGVCEVNIAKHRSGPTDKIELTWVARYTKFSDKAL